MGYQEVADGLVKWPTTGHVTSHWASVLKLPFSPLGLDCKRPRKQP